jgi:hypothetical protein
MAKATKAQLQDRLKDIEAAFDSLMASHNDYVEATDRNAVNHRWAARIQANAHRIRHHLVGDNPT